MVDCGQTDLAVQTEVVVIGLDGVRVVDRVVPQAQIVHRECPVVDRTIGRLSAGDLRR